MAALLKKPGWSAEDWEKGIVLAKKAIMEGRGPQIDPEKVKLVSLGYIESVQGNTVLVCLGNKDSFSYQLAYRKFFLEKYLNDKLGLAMGRPIAVVVNGENSTTSTTAAIISLVSEKTKVSFIPIMPDFDPDQFLIDGVCLNGL